MREKESHPFVRQAVELFDAEVIQGRRPATVAAGLTSPPEEASRGGCDEG